MKSKNFQIFLWKCRQKLSWRTSVKFLHKIFPKHLLLGIWSRVTTFRWFWNVAWRHWMHHHWRKNNEKVSKKQQNWCPKCRKPWVQNGKSLLFFQINNAIQKSFPRETVSNSLYRDIHKVFSRNMRPRCWTSQYVMQSYISSFEVTGKVAHLEAIFKTFLS